MAITPESIKTYNRMVEQVNRQMRRLVQHAKESGDRGSLNWAYRTAVADTQAIYGAGSTRFRKVSEKMLKDADSRASAEVMMRRATKAMEEFRSMPTYSIKGIKETYSKQAESFSKGAGTEFTADDLAGVFETGLWQMLISAGYGSETTRRMVGEIKQNAEDLKKLRKQKKAMRFTPESGEYAERLNDLLSGDRSAARVLGRYLDSI